MSCELVGLTAADACITSDGGIYQVQIVDASKVTGVTFDADGQITAFVMASLGQWETYDHDDDDSAKYDQTSQRQNKKVTITQNGFFKYAGVSATKIKFANGIKNCCALIAILRSNSGVNYVQGLEQKDGEWILTKKKLKATPAILTDTGAGEDRVEVNLISEGRDFSPHTTLSSANIQAL